MGERPLSHPSPVEELGWEEKLPGSEDSHQERVTFHCRWRPLGRRGWWQQARAPTAEGWGGGGGDSVRVKNGPHCRWPYRALQDQPALGCVWKETETRPPCKGQIVSIGKAPSTEGQSSSQPWPPLHSPPAGREAEVSSWVGQPREKGPGCWEGLELRGGNAAAPARPAPAPLSESWEGLNLGSAGLFQTPVFFECQRIPDTYHPKPPPTRWRNQAWPWHQTRWGVLSEFKSTMAFIMLTGPPACHTLQRFHCLHHLWIARH